MHTIALLQHARGSTSCASDRVDSDLKLGDGLYDCRAPVQGA